jgi:hypothetical protein
MELFCISAGCKGAVEVLLRPVPADSARTPCYPTALLPEVLLMNFGAMSWRKNFPRSHSEKS